MGVLPVCLGLHLHACCVRSCTYVYVCVCMCVFAALPQYKRGHRKTASFGAILDVPKIVVTGISGPGRASRRPRRSLLVAVAVAGFFCAPTWPSPCVSLHMMPAPPPQKISTRFKSVTCLTAVSTDETRPSHARSESSALPLLSGGEIWPESITTT